MATDNQTTIAGNLVETPELRFTQLRRTGSRQRVQGVACGARVQRMVRWSRSRSTLSAR